MQNIILKAEYLFIILSCVFFLSISSVIGFEFTQELSIFDLLGIHLYHGWLADPSDQITYPVVIPHSYNQLVEHTINNATSTDTRLAEEGINNI